MCGLNWVETLGQRRAIPPSGRPSSEVGLTLGECRSSWRQPERREWAPASWAPLRRWTESYEENDEENEDAFKWKQIIMISLKDTARTSTQQRTHRACSTFPQPVHPQSDSRRGRESGHRSAPPERHLPRSWGSCTWPARCASSTDDTQQLAGEDKNNNNNKLSLVWEDAPAAEDTDDYIITWKDEKEDTKIQDWKMLTLGHGHSSEPKKRGNEWWWWRNGKQ